MYCQGSYVLYTKPFSALIYKPCVLVSTVVLVCSKKSDYNPLFSILPFPFSCFC